MTAQGLLVYGVTGNRLVAPPALYGSGAPGSNLNPILGQPYFDTSTSPRTGYVWTGAEWATDNTSGGSFTTLTVTGLSTLGAITQVGTANINATGTAATNIGNATGGTAITGDETVTSGNVIINSAAKQLRVHGGAVTDFIGTGVLTLGTVTIANTNIAATDRIFIQRTAANASTTMGELSYTISAGASFTVTSLILGTPGSTQTGDLSSFTYFIVRQV